MESRESVEGWRSEEGNAREEVRGRGGICGWLSVVNRVGSMDEGEVKVLYIPIGKAAEVQVRQTRSYNGRSRARVAR
jgi:hypothetical protein